MFPFNPLKDVFTFLFSKVSILKCYKNTFSICFQMKYSMPNAFMEHFTLKIHYTKSKYLHGAH